MASIAVVYHSGFGHTKAVAESVCRGAARVPGTRVELIGVDELPDPGKERTFSGPTAGKWPRLLEADGVLFGSPTYMGSISADFKRFMEWTSPLWFTQSLKDKLAGGFVNSGTPSGDKLNAMMDLVVFAGQHSMVWVTQGVWPSIHTGDGKELNRLGSWVGVMTHSTNEPADKTPPAGDHLTAEAYGERFAQAVRRWVRGKDPTP
ncbi:MAG: flavodoxin family protein [Phycisphaeraceae bacterium]|nr:flavodoxin family protein [Phycisphaerae bacterium]MBX3391325.1 flavodoxin family protein [Phycisphaeraceae bacterium]